MKNYLIALVFSVSIGQALGYQQLPDSVYQKQELGSSLFTQFKFAEAIPLLEETASIFKENGIWKNYFECKYYLNVYIFFNTRNAEQAIDSMQFDLDLARDKMGDMSEGMGDMYFGLGWLHDNTINENGKGAEYYRLSLETFEKSVGLASAKTAKASANYTLILVNLDRNNEAEKILGKAIKIYEATYDPKDLAWARLYNTAFYFYREISMQDQALKYAQAMYELIKEEKTSQFYPRACRNLSMVHFDLREFETSRDYALMELDQLTEGNEDVNRRSLIGVYNNLGRISEYIDISEAVGYTKQAWDEKKAIFGASHPTTLSSGLNYGNLLSKLGQPKKALATLFDQQKLSNDPESTLRSAALLTLAHFRDGQFEETKKYMQATRNAFLNNQMSNEILAFHYYIMGVNPTLQSLIKLNDDESLKLAMELFTEADSISNSYWKNLEYYDDQRSFLNANSALYILGSNLFRTLYSKEQKIEYANQFIYSSDKCKAALSYPTFLMASKMQRLDIPSEILNYKRQLDQELTNLQSQEIPNQAQLIKKTRERDSLSDVISASYPAYFKERLSANYATVKELQENLDESSVYLIYQSGLHSIENINMGITTMLITKDNVQLWNSPVENLNLLVEDFLSAVQTKQETTQNNEELYRLLHLDKVGNLDGIKHITIVPSEELFYLPIGMLSDSEGRYLIEDYTIRYLQSASLGLYLKAPQQTVNVASLVAHEIGQATRGGTPTQTTPVLSNTREEVDEIESLIGGKILQNLSKKDILESFRRSDLIHLATHAEVNLQTPGKSVMYLANHPDSVIYAYELYNQNLKASLVTLSACNTGVGKIQSGEGIQSLGKAFSYAGCPNLIMSHWAVNDEATAELMQYLYKNLKDGMAKDEALRQAKLTYLSNADPVKAHPYYWAGFVFSGDPAPLTFQAKSSWWWMLPIGLVIIIGVSRMRRRNQS